MKNMTTKRDLMKAAQNGALVAIAVQLSLGTVALAASDTLMNGTLPLPDQPVKRVQHTAPPNVTGTPGATAVSMRFFGLKRNADAAKPAETKAPTTTAPQAVAAGASTIGGVNVKLKPEIKTENTTSQPVLETNSSWLEDSANTKSATTTTAPAAPALLRDAIAVPTEAATATSAAPAETPAATVEAPTTAAETPTATAETPAPTAEATIAPAEQVVPPTALQAETPVKPESSMALLTTPPGDTASHSNLFDRAPIWIDNDEEIEQEATIEYEEMPLDEAGTKVKAGARFPIVITSEITSRTAKKGDPVQGRLKYDLKIGDRMVAAKGATVRGHLNYALPARTPLASMVSANRWYKNSGCLGVTFDEIINEKGEHIPLVAEPARAALYVKNKAEGRVLGINHKGQIAGPWSQQLKYKSIRVGMNFAMAPLGAMSFGAMPVALGVIGAANPSFAFMKPVGTNVRHRRLKGFAWGFLSGIPGSWLIEDTTVKGQEAVIKPGDEFLAELRQEFTGEPASEAEMLGGADAKVKGEVVGSKDGKVKEKGKRK